MPTAHEEPHLRAGGACCPRRRWAAQRSWRACWPTPCRERLRCSGSLCSATAGSQSGLSHPPRPDVGGSAPGTCRDRGEPVSPAPGPAVRSLCPPPSTGPGSGTPPQPSNQAGTMGAPKGSAGDTPPPPNKHASGTQAPGPWAPARRQPLRVQAKATTQHVLPGVLPRCKPLAPGQPCCGVGKLHCPLLLLYPLCGKPGTGTGRGQSHRPHPGKLFQGRTGVASRSRAGGGLGPAWTTRAGGQMWGHKALTATCQCLPSPFLGPIPPDVHPLPLPRSPRANGWGDTSQTPRLEWAQTPRLRPTDHGLAAALADLLSKLPQGSRALLRRRTQDSQGTWPWPSGCISAGIWLCKLS